MGPVLISAFIEQVNAERLCGYGDWRMPTRAELLGLVDFTKLPGEGIDPKWFPNPPGDKTWTASCVTCDVYM